MNNILINISIKKVIKFFIVVVFFLFILGLFSNYLIKIKSLFELENLLQIFYLDGENNIPTWFSTILFLFASFLLFIVSSFKKGIKDLFAYSWGFLSIVFLFLSVDESASVHESIGYFLHKFLETTGFLYFSWVIVGSLFLLFLVFYLYKFIFSLPIKTLKVFIISAVIFIFGAIGMEMLGSNQFYYHGANNWLYIIFSTLEEILEMIGLIVFIYGLLSYIKENKILTNLLVD
jgi:hypothetical protein